jgi:MazG family protein
VKLIQTEKLLALMSQLRNPEGGCPWDLRQTFSSLIPYTIEEVYEVVDAIERADMEDLRGELGDLLLQVVFYAQLAAEQNLFDFEQIAESINAKLIHRHPHVFANVVFESDDQRQQAWEQAKAQERSIKSTQDSSILSGIAANLPALMYAEKIQDRAAQQGFDWQETAPVFNKLHEELQELEQAWQFGNESHIYEEIGDLLLVTVNLARHLKINPELALKHSIAKFSNRFRYLEQQVALSNRQLTDCDLAELENFWQQAKMQN